MLTAYQFRKFATRIRSDHYQMKISEINLFDFLEFYEIKTIEDGVDFIERKVELNDERMIRVHQYFSTYTSKIENHNFSIVETIRNCALSRVFKREIIEKLRIGFQSVMPRYIIKIRLRNKIYFKRTFDRSMYQFNSSISPIDDGQVFLKPTSGKSFAETLCESMKLKNLLGPEESKILRKELGLKTTDCLLSVFDFIRLSHGLICLTFFFDSINYCQIKCQD
jgi:hypothetical protein